MSIKSLVNLLYLASREHDIDAIECLVQKFLPIIKKHAKILGYDGAESDLIIRLIEQVYRLNLIKINNFNEGQAVSYVAQMIKNAAIDIHRKRCSQVQEIYLTSISDLPDCKLKSKEIVKELIEILNKKQKMVIIAKYFYGYSDKEIGDALGVSRQAINKIHNRALNIMKNQARGDNDGNTDN